MKKKAIQTWINEDDFTKIKSYCDNKRKKVSEFLRESALREAGIVQ
jgi:hypothetical protein